MASIQREQSATEALDSVLRGEIEETDGDENAAGSEISQLVALAEESLSAGKPGDAVPMLEKAVLICNQGDAELCSVLWNMLGNVHLRLGDFSKAVYCHLHDLASCRQAGDGEGCTKAYANLGLAFKHGRQYEKAGQCFASQLQSCERRRHQAGIARAYNNLAQLTLLMAKNGMKECQDLSNVAQGAGRENSEAASISKLKEKIKQRLSQAVKFFQSHLQIVSKQRDKLAEARAHGNIAECFELQNKYGKAIEHHTRRLTMAEDQHDLEGMSRGHCNIGNCLRSLREFHEAVDHYMKDLEISKELGDVSGQAVTQRNLANTYDMMGDYTKALKWHTDNFTLVQQLGQRNEQILALGYIASIHEDMEQYDQAIDCFTKQLDLYAAANSSEGQEQATGNVQRIHKLIQRKRDGLLKNSPAPSPKLGGRPGFFDSARRLREGTLRIFNRKDRRSILAKEESPWVTDVETPPMRHRQFKGTNASYSVSQGKNTSAVVGHFNPISESPSKKTEKALRSVISSLDQGDMQGLLQENFTLRAPSQDGEDDTDGAENRVSIYASTFGGRNHAMHLQLGVGSMLQEMAQENPLFTSFEGEKDWKGLLSGSASASMVVKSSSMDMDMGMFEAAQGSADAN